MTGYDRQSNRFIKWVPKDRHSRFAVFKSGICALFASQEGVRSIGTGTYRL